MARKKVEAAPKKAPPPRGRGKRGPKGSYLPEYDEQARRLCEQFAATDADLAQFFGVSIATIKNWQARHESFRLSMRVGKDATDDRVERSLYERAVGYTHPAVKIFLPKGSRKPVIVPYDEHVPPDVNAASLWLANRRRETWKLKVEHEHSGEVQVGVVVVPAKVPAVARTLTPLLPSAEEKAQAEAVPALVLPVRAPKP